MSSEADGAVTKEMEQGGELVPQRRFPEFHNAGKWQQGTLGDWLFEPKKKNRSLQFGPEDVLSVSGEFGCVNQIQFMGRSYAGASVKEYNIVEIGDIVYTKSPLKACPNGIIKTNKRAAGIVSVLYAVYRPRKNTDPRFIDYYFSSDVKLNNYLQPLVKKGPKNSILVNDSEVLRGAFAAPSFPEQQKIAECLSSLDAVIAAEGERLAALKAHKKGLMQALFPAPGQTTPRLRFPEFEGAGEWKMTTVGRAAETFSGGTPSTGEKSFYGGGIPFIRSAEIASETTELTLTDTGLKRSSAKMVQAGDVLLALYGANSGDVALAKLEGAINQAILCLRHANSNAFLYQFLSSQQEVITRTYLQGGQGNLSADIVKSIPLPSPDVDEMKLIASCLTEVDDLISAQHQRLTALKTHKLALMQQLFTPPWVSA